MPDADDFDVEELRRLMRGEAGKQPGPTPAARTTTRASASERRKNARSAAGAKPKRGAGRKQR